MVTLITLLQSTQNAHCILYLRFVDHHLLETTLEGLVLLKVLLILVERCGTNSSQLATRKGRLEDVCRIHRSAALTRAHKGVNLIYK